MSDKTSRQCFECCWRQCEASFIDCLMNWQKPPVSSAKQQRVINNTALASVSQPGGPIPLSSFFFFSFIHHNFYTILFFLLEEKHISNYLRAIHYKWHPPHCTAKIFRVLKKMGLCLRTVFFCIDEKGDRGKESFYLLTKCYAGAWISAFTVSLSSVWRICWRELVLLERALRESLIWGGESPGGGIHITSDVKKIHYAAKRIKAKGSITSIQSQYNCSAFLFLLLPCVSEVTQFSQSLNLRRMLCGNGWGNQTSGCLSGFWTEIK